MNNTTKTFALENTVLDNIQLMNSNMQPVSQGWLEGSSFRDNLQGYFFEVSLNNNVLSISIDNNELPNVNTDELLNSMFETLANGYSRLGNFEVLFSIADFDNSDGPDIMLYK